MHGGHVQNSAHYAGRALDVESFGDTPVGWNEPTWNAVVTAIQSGQFQKIGTFRRLAMQAQIQSLAKEYGVEVFVDEGDGPHVHFQVAH